MVLSNLHELKNSWDGKQECKKNHESLFQTDWAPRGMAEIIDSTDSLKEKGANLNFDSPKWFRSFKPQFAEPERRESRFWFTKMIQVIQTPIHWKREEQISVLTKRFRDSNSDSLNGRESNLSLDWKSLSILLIKGFPDFNTDSLNRREPNLRPDQTIHLFKHTSYGLQKSQSQYWLKDSLTQTLTD